MAISGLSYKQWQCAGDSLLVTYGSKDKERMGKVERGFFGTGKFWGGKEIEQGGSWQHQHV